MKCTQLMHSKTLNFFEVQEKINLCCFCIQFTLMKGKHVYKSWKYFLLGTLLSQLLKLWQTRPMLVWTLLWISLRYVRKQSSIIETLYDLMSMFWINRGEVKERQRKWCCFQELCRRTLHCAACRFKSETDNPRALELPEEDLEGVIDDNDWPRFAILGSKQGGMFSINRFQAMVI